MPQWGRYRHTKQKRRDSKTKMPSTWGAVPSLAKTQPRDKDAICMTGVSRDTNWMCYYCEGITTGEHLTKCCHCHRHRFPLYAEFHEWLEHVNKFHERRGSSPRG